MPRIFYGWWVAAACFCTFGIIVGIPYYSLPLAAEQFGVSALGRVMGIIMPVDLLGLTWLPYLVSLLQERFGDYRAASGVVFAVAVLGAVFVSLLPKVTSGGGAKLGLASVKAIAG